MKQYVADALETLAIDIDNDCIIYNTADMDADISSEIANNLRALASKLKGEASEDEVS